MSKSTNVMIGCCFSGCSYRVYAPSTSAKRKRNLHYRVVHNTGFDSYPENNKKMEKE